MSDYKGWEALMTIPTEELEILKEMLDKELNKRNLSDPAYIYKVMDSLVGQAYIKDNWDEIWDEFWKISKQLQEFWDVEYYDPDTTYKEDILARFNSFKEYYEENK